MTYSTETIRSFIRRCQLRLDQEMDVETNLWSQAEMLEYLNEGCREVWQAVREEHQNWFVRQVDSTDPIMRVGGRSYNPKALQITQGRDRLYLPPDFRELLFMEGFPPSQSGQIGDAFFPNVRFEYRNLTQRRFREDALDNTTTGAGSRTYIYDVVFSKMNGAYILLSPPLSPPETIQCRIQYLAGPLPLTLDDTFEGTGFTLEMTDAILAYVCYMAAQKEGVDMNVNRLYSMFGLKRELAVRAAGPKQTRDEEVVEGYLEEEL